MSVGQRVTRRAVLLGCAGVVAAVALVVVRSGQGRQQALLEAVLRRRLGFVSLDSDGTRRFARDYWARVRGDERWKLAVLSAIAPLYPVWLGPSTPWVGRLVERFESRLVSSFLLGSDFFRRAPADARPVRYVGFYDPYTMICGNPFARFEQD